MQSLDKKALRMIESLSKLHDIKDYFLIGGTALSLQINHRLSEDLDFCKWLKPGLGETKVNWPAIKEALEKICKNVKEDILDFNQVKFIADKVNLSFYTIRRNRSPVVKPKQ